MKQKINIVIKQKSQNRQGIKDALSGMYQTLTCMASKTRISIDSLVQDNSKGPPRRTRSQEEFRCLAEDG